MTARAAAHIRRLALILALLDMSNVVETKHLHTAFQLFDYCKESARFIFAETTKEQERIVSFVRTNGPTTLAQISEDVFKQNMKIEWIKMQIDGCK